MDILFTMDLNRYKLGLGLVIGMISMGSLAQVSAAGFEQRWQQNILINPSPAQLAREHRGQITIFDGLTDKLISNVMDTQFERLDSMMFTRVIITDAKGKPKRDAKTGEVQFEDDGC